MSDSMKCPHCEHATPGCGGMIFRVLLFLWWVVIAAPIVLLSWANYEAHESARVDRIEKALKLEPLPSPSPVPLLWWRK